MLRVSGSPHIHSPETSKKIMWYVVLALLPSFIVSVVFFGYRALLLNVISVLVCVLTEYLIQKYLLKAKPTVDDGSAVITGLLLAFNVPSSLPIWQLIIGDIIAIGVAKMTFGGLGQNLFNPALIGRVFLLISFPVDMTTWPVPNPPGVVVDAVSGPTALGFLKEGLMSGKKVDELLNSIPSYYNMFLGAKGGSLGEVSVIAILIGAMFLMWKKVITWHIPISYIGTVFVFTWLLNIINPSLYVSPVFHLLTGGLMLGAFFMATDYSTSPMYYQGMLVYGIGCGVLTVLIRVWGGYPEGVSFAILIMNSITPLINRFFKPKMFGAI